MHDIKQHITTMPDGTELVLREDPMADHHVKLWADHEQGSTFLGYVVQDNSLLPMYLPGRALAVSDPLFITHARQMFYKTI
jgi:hypothetical protein